MDVAEHYVFLEAEAGTFGDERVLTRPVGLSLEHGDLLVAIDGTGARHLLVPLAPDTPAAPRGSKAISVAKRALDVEGVTVWFLDLRCVEPRLRLVFERLVDDIVGRLSERGDQPLRVCQRAIDEWRDLFEDASEDLPRSAVIGLVGELEVLRILANQEPVSALDSWLGPQAAVHDFVNPSNRAIEVKTTASVDGNYVEVSNADQLDPALVASLLVVAVHVRPDPTAPSLDDRIEELFRMGVPRRDLINRVADAGYIFEAYMGEARYAVRSMRAWPVDATFPGIRRSDFSPGRLRGVSKLQYELALDSAPRPMPEEELMGMLRTWMEL